MFDYLDFLPVSEKEVNIVPIHYKQFAFVIIQFEVVFGTFFLNDGKDGLQCGVRSRKESSVDSIFKVGDFKN